MLRAIGALVIVLGTVGATGTAQPSAAPPIDIFFDAAHVDDRIARKALEQIGAQWNDSYTPLIIDLARQLRRAPRVTDSALPSASFGDDDPSGGGGDAGGTTDRGSRPMPREAIVRSRLCASSNNRPASASTTH